MLLPAVPPLSWRSGWPRPCDWLHCEFLVYCEIGGINTPVPVDWDGIGAYICGGWG